MKVTVQDIDIAAKRLEEVTKPTPLTLSKRLSQKYDANIYLKREDIQEVRSFKIRGAYNKIRAIRNGDLGRGVVAASTGNHAQGVAFSCALLAIKGTVFMPVVTPMQKIKRVKQFGGKYIEVKLIGNNFHETLEAANEYCKKKKAIFVHGFDDPEIIAGQGTIGKEVYEKLKGNVDYLLCPVGGGGLIAGIASYLKQKDKKITIVGVVPNGAASMYESLKKGKPVTLSTLDTFVDGVAVKTVSQLTFSICKDLLKKVVKIPEGLLCSVMIELYQSEGIITEPAGALAVGGLDSVADEIKGKNVVCVVSGGNNDILRYPEIMERSLVYQGRKHYFLIEFAQKPGQLKNFLNKALGPTDDIVLFEYTKKTNKEKGPALVGIELADKKDYEPLLDRMKKLGINYTVLKSDDLLYKFLI